MQTFTLVNNQLESKMPGKHVLKVTHGSIIKILNMHVENGFVLASYWNSILCCCLDPLQETGHINVTTSWPLMLTTICVLAQGQRWLMTIISLHPLSKVSKRKHVVGGRQVDCRRTKDFFQCVEADAGYSKPEKRVSLLCWPVAPVLSRALTP